jgi:hypothetical protein
MAKVIAPFKIVGTLDDLNFYVDQNNENIVRRKGKTGVSSEEFKSNPIFTKVRNHGKEFGAAVKKAQSFRMLAHDYYNRAKDGSFAGRANKLMLEVVQEDTSNVVGARTFENGILAPDVITYFLGFEGNRTRPLNKVLKTTWDWNETTLQLTLSNFSPKTNIDWPEEAQQVHLGIAHSYWNYVDGSFETHYSKEVLLKNEEGAQTIKLTTDCQEVVIENSIQLVFFFVGFSMQERKKTKELKRINNTISIIWSK